MSNLYRFENIAGFEEIINDDNSGLKHINFNGLYLEAGEEQDLQPEDREFALVLQKGDFTVNIEEGEKEVFSGVTAYRESVFDQLPTVIYLPPGSKMNIKSENGLEMLAYSAKCDSERKAEIIAPQDVNEVYSGIKNWRRRVRVILGPESDISEKLIVGESVSIPGGWIGFPAHKHDIECDTEYPLEEIFSFKLDGAQGAMALHHTYDTDRDIEEHYLIDDDNYAVAIPDGYHTSQAMPGCRYYLLWGLAGDCKEYKLTFDPDFAWLQDAETLFEEGVGKNLGDVMVGKVKTN